MEPVDYVVLEQNMCGQLTKAVILSESSMTDNLDVRSYADMLKKERQVPCCISYF